MHTVIRSLKPSLHRLLLKRRRGKASFFISVENFDTWHQASTVGK